MKLKIKLVLSCSLMMVVSMLAVLITQPIRASDGIELSPPFNGIPRVTAYFDHDTPNYTTDGFVHIYNGERKPATGYPTYTGEPYPYDGHDGWDFSMKEWTDVLAAAPGKVVVSEDNWKDGGYGHVIIIKHSNDYYTMYAHLRQRLVFEDDPVTVGQHIGESGDSGSPGSYHLHFGVRHGGYLNTNYSVDPFGWRGSGKDPLWDHNNKESSCLWAGAPGGDISCADIIVEDDGTGWEQNGNWSESSAGNGYRQHWTNVWNPAWFWVQWQPWYNQVRYPGYYQIHTYIPKANSTTTNAIYDVHHGGYNTTSVPVNQNSSDPFWASLNSYQLYSTDYIMMYDYTGEPTSSAQIVADSMKFSADIVYLPQVDNAGGWVSSIVIRNNATTQASVGINYYNSTGGSVVYHTVVVPARGSAIVSPSSGFSGSAVVVSNQDISVVVETIKSVAGSLLHAEGYTGFSQGFTRLCIPSVANRGYEQSEIFVMNTDDSATTVTVSFSDRDGNSKGTDQTFTLQPNGSERVQLSTAGLPSDFLGSASIVSTKKVVANTRTTFSTTFSDMASYEGQNAGTLSSLYFPQVKRRQYGGAWYDYSGIVVQNLDDTNASIEVHFYDRDGDEIPDTSFTDTILPGSSHGYNTRHYGDAPDTEIDNLGTSFNGSVRVDSTNGQQIIGLNKTWIEGGINAIETHVGEKGGTSTLIVPLVYRKTLNGQSANPQDNMAWESYTGVIVHNLGDTEANVTIYIYDQNGLYTTSFTDDIPANSPHGYNTRYGGYIPTANLNSLGYNFVGSMYVTSNTGEPLIGLVDVGLETDAIYYYNADW